MIMLRIAWVVVAKDNTVMLISIFGVIIEVNILYLAQNIWLHDSLFFFCKLGIHHEVCNTICISSQQMFPSRSSYIRFIYLTELYTHRDKKKKKINWIIFKKWLVIIMI